MEQLMISIWLAGAVTSLLHFLYAYAPAIRAKNQNAKNQYTDSLGTIAAITASNIAATIAVFIVLLVVWPIYLFESFILGGK